MLNFVLCDDNTHLLTRLENMLNSIFIQYDYDAQISYKSNDAEKILNYVLNNHTDVLILDINLKSNISGIELAQKIRNENKNIYIIFTTGHLEYAMLAYKVKTFDYLAKPITQERLSDTVSRLFEDALNTPKTYISIGNKAILDQNEIKFIKRDGMKLVFYTDSNAYETYSSFSKIMNKLPENFIRCHKSYIANINQISNIDSTNNTIFFSSNHKCFIGPKYKEDFMNYFSKDKQLNNTFTYTSN